MSISATLQIVLGCALLAALPAAGWGYVFYKAQPEDRLHTVLTFILGALAVFPILLYKYLWKFFPSINIQAYTKNFENDLIGISGFVMIPLSVILFFMFIGVIEEIMKLSVVHAVDDNKIRTIDDAIMFSIVAALGFAFTENILYFYTIWAQHGPQNLLQPFLLRSVFSTFAHILFSALFGYYYGIAHFATPLLQKQLREKRSRVWNWFHAIFKFHTNELFHEQKMLEGLTLAILLHAFYNIFLEMNWLFLMVPYLVLGGLFVYHLFESKENNKQLGLLLTGECNHLHPDRVITRGMSRVLRRVKAVVHI